MDVADEHDFQIWHAVGRCLLGAAETSLGRHDVGLANIATGLALYQGARTPPIFWPMLRYLEAGASLLAGQYDRGLEAIDVGIELFGDRGGSILLPEFQVLRGDLLGGRGSVDEARDAAEECFRLASAAAAALETRTSQIRAATRLARIAATDADRARWLAELESVLDLLTEGFETADVVDAREVV